MQVKGESGRRKVSVGCKPIMKGARAKAVATKTQAS